MQDQNMTTLKNNSDRFVASHFADLQGDTVDLYVGSDRFLHIKEESKVWKPEGIFPLPTGNALLYLTLGGVKVLINMISLSPFYGDMMKEPGLR